MLHPNVLHLCLIFLPVPWAFQLCFPSEPHHRHDCNCSSIVPPCCFCELLSDFWNPLPRPPVHLRAEHPSESHTELLLPLPVLPAQIQPLPLLRGMLLTMAYLFVWIWSGNWQQCRSKSSFHPTATERSDQSERIIAARVPIGRPEAVTQMEKKVSLFSPMFLLKAEIPREECKVSLDKQKLARDACEHIVWDLWFVSLQWYLNKHCIVSGPSCRRCKQTLIWALCPRPPTCCSGPGRSLSPIPTSQRKQQEPLCLIKVSPLKSNQTNQRWLGFVVGAGPGSSIPPPPQMA